MSGEYRANGPVQDISWVSTTQKRPLGRVSGVIDSTFITSGDWRLGSTSAAAIDKDIVFTVPACSYPALMQADGAYHRVVGECYVDGLMNGEGVSRPV
jgi:hypothetical protein